MIKSLVILAWASFILLVGGFVVSCGDDDDYNTPTHTDEQLVWQQYIHPETHEAIWCLVEYSGDAVVCP